MAQEQLSVEFSRVQQSSAEFSRVPRKAIHHRDDRSIKPAATDTPGRHEKKATSAEMAFSNERAAEITAKIDEEIERFEEQTRELIEDTKLLEGDIRRQESQSAALLESPKASRRWLSYQMGKASEDIAWRRSMIEKKSASVEGSQQWVAQGRKWQRGIEVAGTLVELDKKIKDCLMRIDQERDQLNRLQQEAEQLHSEQREMTIETGGTAWALLSEELQGVERLLRESESTRAVMDH